MATEQCGTAVEKVRAAEETADELRAELKTVGVTLPSLRLDPASCAATDPEPLVDLGRCNLATARQLVAILRERGR